MAEYLSQSEANALLEMEKHAEAGASYRFPAKGERLSIPLLSADEKENFHVDVNRRSIALYKCTFNGRTRGNVILARLDLNGSPHRNPDGEEIDCPHLHLYREGHGDKWAYSLPDGVFSDLANLKAVCQDFLTYFRVVSQPQITSDLLT
ncbi:DUF6978 family protein [Rhizobium sp. RAF56]|uniref:DUF6978 family protein n=1 Tax=Rhizobium sp. RAF56 TaxID=3233062 RepID=UPI003F9A0829